MDAATGAVNTIGGLAVSGNGADNTNRYSLRWSAAAAAQYQAADGATNALFGTGTITAGVPFHICAVESSTTSRALYFNGGSKATNAQTVNPPAVDRTSIGCHDRSAASQALAAGDMVAEFAIWNTALSDADAAMLGLGFCPLFVKPDNLVTYCPLIGKGSSEPDLVGGFTQVIQGSLSAMNHPRVVFLRGPRWARTAPPVLTPVGASSGHSVAVGGLAQTNLLAVLAATAGHTVTVGALNQTFIAKVANAIAGHISDPTKIVNSYALLVPSPIQGHTATVGIIEIFVAGLSPELRTYVVLSDGRAYRILGRGEGIAVTDEVRNLDITPYGDLVQ